MKDLFVVLARLLGLWLLVQAVATAILGIAGASQLDYLLQARPDHSWFKAPAAIGLVVNIAWTFLCAMVLLLRAPWLAERLRIPESEWSPATQRSALLHTLLAVLGVWIALSGLTQFGGSLLLLAQRSEYMPEPWRDPWKLREVIQAALFALLGVLLVLRAPALARWLGRRTPGAGA